MAKPIGETPTLYGKEARDFLRKMNEPPSKEEIEFRKNVNLKEQSYFNFS